MTMELNQHFSETFSTKSWHDLLVIKHSHNCRNYLTNCILFFERSLFFFLQTATSILCDVLMCDNVICSLLYTLLVFCFPPYPQFTAAKRSPCGLSPGTWFSPHPSIHFCPNDSLPSITVYCLYPLDLVHGITEFTVFSRSSSSCPCEAPVIGKSTITWHT